MHKRAIKLFWALSCTTALLGVAVPARAIDGVVLIDQARVAAAGGFPFHIIQPGSYRLAGNLTLPNASTDGIRADVYGVTIDLNGFKISGPSTCNQVTGTCSPAGGGVGVFALGGRVINGFVVGMAGHAVVADTVEDLQVFGNNAGVRCNRCLRITARQNASTGIDASGGFVRDSFALDNGGDGIKGYQTAVSNVVASGNGKNAIGNFGHGINVGASVVSHSVASGNRLFGITAANSTVSDNSASGNKVGISAQASRVHGNTVLDNTDGIYVTFSTVTNNIVQANPNGPGYALVLGISTGGTNAYGGNTLNFFGPWGISGTGVQIAPNVCNNALCP